MPRIGREQRGLRPDVRLARADERRVDQLEALDTVGLPSSLQCLERLDFVVVVRDDQLAAAAMGNGVGRAELVEHARACRRSAVPSGFPPDSRCRRE